MNHPRPPWNPKNRPNQPDRNFHRGNNSEPATKPYVLPIDWLEDFARRLGEAVQKENSEKVTILAEKRQYQQDLENERSKVFQAETQRQHLEAESQAKDNQLKMFKEKLASFRDVEKTIEQLTKAKMEAEVKLSGICEIVLQLLASQPIDLPEFARTAFGLELSPYPTTDWVTLHRESAEINDYDFGGMLPFSQDRPEIHFKIERQGWRSQERIWVEAVLAAPSLEAEE